MSLRPRPARLASLLLLIAAYTALPSDAGVITVDVAVKGTVAEVGISNGGLCMSPVPSADCQPVQVDVERLAERCSVFGVSFHDIEKVSILLLVPGHAITTFTGTAESQTWTPVLTALPKRSVQGRVVPPPARGSTLTLRYSLVEAMGFFGYVDGSVPTIELGTVRLQGGGRFTIDLPDLQADPFLDGDREIRLYVQSARGEPLETYRVGLSAFYSDGPLVLDEPL